MRAGFITLCVTVSITGASIIGATTSVSAAPACGVDALNALNVANMSLTDAKPVAAAGKVPAYCDVHGTVVTHGSGVGDGLARFEMQVPEVWHQRFLFLGVGANAGNLRPSANATDRASALGKGYVTVVTDTGHVGNGVSAAWTRLPDGKPDTVKMVDFFYRAAHDVAVAGKAFAQAYYGAKVEHAYFDGCSTGGRMAMMEAERYPADYDGVIAGDPLMSFHTYTARAVVQKAALSVPAAYISNALLKEIDARVTSRCDAIDGAKDGLVQNPTACPVRAEDLLCHPGETHACLNADQMRVLKSYTSDFRDKRGKVIFTPWPMTDMADPMGVAYTSTGESAPDLSDLPAPWKAHPDDAAHGWALVQQMVSYWLGLGTSASVADLDVDPRTNTVGDTMLAMMNSTYADGNVRDPKKLGAFIAQGRKMILYHGASDPSIPPSQSIAFYRELMAREKGLARTQANVRLFLVPGMHHCEGGPAPDQFDTLSALEAWVEQGKAPEAIQASTKPEAAVQHHLPLCPYPRQGRYSGTGDVNDAANWRCVATKG